MLDNSRLRIAIQKSGRLSEDSRELLSRCGISESAHPASPDRDGGKYADRYSARA